MDWAMGSRNDFHVIMTHRRVGGTEEGALYKYFTPISLSIAPKTSHPMPNIQPHAQAFSAASSKPWRLILFGRSIGSPNARSQMSCASGPSPRETPNVAV